MKIKIKNQDKILNIHQLNEVYRLNEGEANANEEAQSESTAWNAMEADAEYQYIQDRKREALPVKIVLSDAFDIPIKLGTPPEDISNIMYAFQNNKARKTKNIGGVMQDPIQTYNLADACCFNAFGNFFEKDITFENNEKQRERNKDEIHSKNESYNYNDFPRLNESALGFGFLVGQGVGTLVSSGLGAAGGAIAGLVATAGFPLAAVGGSAYMLAYWGEEIFGNVEPGGATNDEYCKHLTAATQKMLKPKPSAPDEYKSVVSAITQYVNDILEACNDIAGVLTTDGEKKMADVSKFVKNYMTTTSKKAIEFIETNSKAIEDQKKLETERREIERERDKNNAEKTTDFALKVTGLTSECTDLAEMKYVEQIVNFYKKHVKDNKGLELKDAAESDWKTLISKYKEVAKVNASYEFIENKSILNEGEVTGINDVGGDAPKKDKLIINAAKIYDGLLIEFQNRFEEVFSTIDPKSLPKYEETKEQMKALIDVANKSINSKIDQITKVQQGETAATGGLGQAAKTFLMGHPLESNNLREVWSRHLADLNTRMTNRLSIMTNYKDKTRTLGWIWQVCRTKVPQILARMLTYRYIYALLSNNGFFSYDTPTMEADKHAFQIDKAAYMALPQAKLIWILNNACKDYTEKGEGIIYPDKANGGWLLNDNNVTYGYFLAAKLYGNNGNLSTCANAGQFMANIKHYVNNDKEVAKQLLTYVAGLLNKQPNTNQLINSSNPAMFDKLVDIIKMPDDIKNLKGTINDTYTLISNYSGNLNNLDKEKISNIAKTLSIVANAPHKIHKSYITNKNRLDDIIKNLKDGGDNIDKENVKSTIDEIFGEIVTGIDENAEKEYLNWTNADIKNLFPDGKNIYDKYSSILYLYPSNGWVVYDEFGKEIDDHNSAKAVQAVCKFVSDMLEFEFSGILAYGLDEANKDKEKDESIEEKKKELPQIITNVKEICQNIKDCKAAIVACDTKIQDETNKEKYNSIKQAYIDLYDRVCKQMIANYETVNKENNAIYKLNDSIFKSKSLNAFIEKVLLFNNNDIKDFFSSLKDIDIISINDKNTIKFNDEKITDNDKINILYNLAKTIEKTKENGDYNELKQKLQEIIKIANDDTIK